MFCKFCGTWLRTSYKFCPRCGKSPDSPKESTGSQPVAVSNFKVYAAKKSQERQLYRKPGKMAKKEEIVTINIGIASLANGITKAVRGRSLPLKVAKSVTYDEILKAALEKRTAYDRSFRSDRTYSLVYPDGSDAKTLPGSSETFTLAKYQEDIGKPYSRLLLLLSNGDYETNDKEEANSSPDDSSEESEGPGPSKKAKRPNLEARPYQASSSLPQGISSGPDANIVSGAANGTPAALQLIEELLDMNEYDPMVFPNNSGGPVSADDCVILPKNSDDHVSADNPMVFPNNSAGNPMVFPNNSGGNPMVFPNNSGGNPMVFPNNSAGNPVIFPNNSGGPMSADDCVILPDNSDDHVSADNPMVFPNNSALDHITIKEVRVRRSQLKNDMLEIFSDPTICPAQLEAIIIDSAGKEECGRGSGVREIFTCFWNECFDSLMVGVDERVPCVRHDYDRNKWQTIARILYKGYEACSYFPLKLCKVYTLSCLFGETSFSEEELIDSFKSYISKSEAAIVSKCLTCSIDCQDEELLDFLSDYDCKRMVTQENLPTIIKELAHKELIQKPQYISDCWIPVLSEIQHLIPNAVALQSIYNDRRPTTAKVLALLKATPSSHPESETMANLKRYIRSLDDQKLAAFLSFTTAADVILVNEIQVTFNDMSGLQRRPVSHTCGGILELPCTYLNYCEFRQEFNNVLNVGSWQMDIV